MKSKLITLVLVIAVVVAAALFRKPTQQPSSPVSSIVTQTHFAQFFEEQTFIKGVTESKNSSLPDFSNKQILGGITPHHLLASNILSRFFTAINQNTPNTVVIIGPNHYETGEFPVLMSSYSWETPYGNVQPNLEIIDELNSNSFIEIDETVVPADHAASGLIPYVKYYLPDAKVVPILISNRIKKPEIEQLAEHFVRSLPEDAVLIGAFDFSHYLNEQQAAEKDKVTQKLIETRDYEKILNLNNDYTDSPVSLTLFLMIMDKLHASEMVMLDHTNSGKLLNEPNASNTSYFSMVFLK